jgi:uncharacterized membrane protein YraQ (UPF0718 family)
MWAAILWTMQHVLDFFDATWEMLVASGAWFLAGCLAAGVLHVMLSPNALARHLGPRGVGSTLKATIVGAPLPLCSCSVIPVAASLRRGGASRGATAAFAISTPETGADSVLLTYALFGWPMAVVRPLVAIVTALLAGLGIDRLTRTADEPPAGATQVHTCCDGAGDDCGVTPCCAEQDAPSAGQQRSGIVRALRYGFVTLFDDLGPWLLFGFLLAGLIGVLIPDEALHQYSSSAWAHVLMLGIGLPMYICASSSTPVAAALVAKGLSPGAAIVLLMAGPATNAATMAWAARDLGRRALVIYLVAIGACALGAGYLIDAVGLQITVAAGGGAEHDGHGLVGQVSAIVLLLLLLSGCAGTMRARVVKPGTGSRPACCTGCGRG